MLQQVQRAVQPPSVLPVHRPRCCLLAIVTLRMYYCRYVCRFLSLIGSSSDDFLKVKGAGPADTPQTKEVWESVSTFLRCQSPEYLKVFEEKTTCRLCRMLNKSVWKIIGRQGSTPRHWPLVLFLQVSDVFPRRQTRGSCPSHSLPFSLPPRQERKLFAIE